MEERHERPTWVLWAFLGLQVAVPLVGLIVRWTGGPEYVRFSWQMFSVVL